LSRIKKGCTAVAVAVKIRRNNEKTPCYVSLGEKMQKLQMFAIFDKKALAYANPFYYHQKGQALRALEDSVNDPQSPLNKHPEDFTLFHIGEWDDRTGLVTPLANPQHVEEALAVKKSN